MGQLGTLQSTHRDKHHPTPPACSGSFQQGHDLQASPSSGLLLTDPTHTEAAIFWPLSPTLCPGQCGFPHSGRQESGQATVNSVTQPACPGSNAIQVRKGKRYAVCQPGKNTSAPEKSKHKKCRPSVSALQTQTSLLIPGAEEEKAKLLFSFRMQEYSPSTEDLALEISF